MWVASAFVDILAAYAGAGLLLAIAFVTTGVQRIDHAAAGSGLGFRLIILPGVVALWPVLLWRWATGRTEPPREHNAHRDATSR